VATEHRGSDRSVRSRDEVLRHWADVTGYPLGSGEPASMLPGRPGAGRLTTGLTALLGALARWLRH
jgi:hypothetical protein